DDVTRSREMIKRSRKLASKLNAVLSVSTREKAFPDIRIGLQQVFGLLNKIGRARVTLAEGMDDVANQNATGEIGQVRSQRRALMKRMGYLPVTEGDFLHRDETGDQQWDKVAQTLQELQVESDKLAAIVNGLRRVMKEADKFNVTPDPNSRERFKLELEA